MARLTVAERFRAEGAMNALDVAGVRIRQLDAVREAAQALADAMETCHQCKGIVLVEEQPTHCEDCSWDCDNHEGTECATIYGLHLDLKRKLNQITKAVPPSRTQARREESRVRGVAGGVVTG